MTGSRPLLRLGVSRCLLGDEVRYDGGHRHEPFVTDRLGLLAEWEVVCPEFEVGLGVPREPIALYEDPREPAVRGVETGLDHTDRLNGWAARRLDELDCERLDGFVLKSGSPSCALEPVAVEREGQEVGRSAGLFVRSLRDRDASLPLCDELQLRQAPGQHAFFLRALSRRFARGLRPRLTQEDWHRSSLWRGFFDAHALALLAREQDPDALRDRCEGKSSAGEGLTELGLALARPESPEGTGRAFTTAVDWLPQMDRRLWLVLHPMLEEVRAADMEPEVLRITLQLLAKSTGTARVADQLFLRPLWLGPDGASSAGFTDSSPSGESASRRNTSP